MLTDRTYTRAVRVWDIEQLLRAQGFMVKHIAHFTAPLYYDMVRLVASKVLT